MKNKLFKFELPCAIRINGETGKHNLFLGYSFSRKFYGFYLCLFAKYRFSWMKSRKKEFEPVLTEDRVLVWKEKK